MANLTYNKHPTAYFLFFVWSGPRLMLRAIRIKNLAIIEALDTELRSGLTIITGETGSGKSLLLQAIALGMGHAASPRKILKHGTQKGFVELDVELGNLKEQPRLEHHLKAVLSEYELLDEPEYSEDSVDPFFTLRREFTEKSSRCRINGTPVPKEALEKLAPLWVDMHSQHELSSLLNGEHHQRYLDGCGDNDFKRLLESYSQRYVAWQNVKQQLNRLRDDQAQLERERDFMEFQCEELNDAELENPNEDTEIKADLERLQQSDALIKACERGQHILTGDGGGDESNMVDQFGRLARAWQPFKSIDEKTGELYERIQEHLEGVRELSHELALYQDECSADPEAIDTMVERLDMLEKIKRKYGSEHGPTLEGVMAFHRELTEKLESVTQADANLLALEEEAKVLEADVMELAQLLHAQRETLAHSMNESMTRELRDLALPAAQFEVRLSERPLGDSGMDRVRFTFSANPGEPLKPLDEVASGGELSRVMLALKVVLAGQMSGKTLVFDEIDTGVSGETTQKVAQRLQELAKDNQIMTITHQPLVAVAANHHLYVSKQIDTASQHVHVSVDYLEKGSPVHRQVLAQLTSGNMAGDAVDQFVQTLLDKAEQPAAF